ncbi:MAG: hypothetical protein RL701_1057 [Pseudomonadota bacterium]
MRQPLVGLVIAGLVLLGLACSALTACIASWTGQDVAWAAAPLGLFTAALGLLWIATRFRARPREPAAARPCYLVVGPAKAGKTSLLQQLGELVPAPLRPSARQQLPAWDVWQTSTATWLDTHSDEAMWPELLERLRAEPNPTQLVALLATVSTSHILNTAPRELALIAARLRAQLTDVCRELGVGLPVYLLCTKCDLLTGFTALFAGLTASERAQTLGFVLPLEPASVGSDFTCHFDQLAESVRRAAWVRIGAARGLHERTQAYAFPQQFRGMRAPLSLLIEHIFEPNVRGPTPSLRGVYFLSSARSAGSAYFVRDLFAHTIRREAKPRQRPRV